MCMPRILVAIVFFMKNIAVSICEVFFSRRPGGWKQVHALFYVVWVWIFFCFAKEANW